MALSDSSESTLSSAYSLPVPSSPLITQREHTSAASIGNELLSAYMRLEEQVKILQNELSMRRAENEILVRERDIHEAAYMKLAESLLLTSSTDLTGLDNGPSVGLQVAFKSKDIVVPSYDRANFPSDFIWTKEDWKKVQEKPSAHLQKRSVHALQFVVDKLNKVIPLERVSAIRTMSRRVFVDIWNLGEEPKTWGTASVTASKMYYHEMVTFFPELGYCDHNWKCEALATTTYTSWRRNHIGRLICEGKYKPTAHDIVEFSNLETFKLDTNDDSGTIHGVEDRKGKRRAYDVDSDSLASPPRMPSTSKKHKSTVDPSLPSDSLDTANESDSTFPLRCPIKFRARPLKFANPLKARPINRPIQPSSPEDIDAQPEDIDAQPEHIDAQPEHIDVRPEDIDARPEDIDKRPEHMDEGLSSTSKERGHTDKGLESTPTEHNEGPTGPAKKARKMQVSKGQNGRNLCAREWLARNKAGTAAEFKTYYDGLSLPVKKSYNELAIQKVADGTWPG